MRIDKYSVNKIIMYSSIIIFALITVTNMMNHFPWADEALAWQVAKNLNIENVLQKLHEQGHFILWYILLLPFAKLNICYPYSMFLINWLAYFVAIVVMWKNAPFNTLIKVGITFSWLSLNYFPIVARCYSIGILGLFILLSLYKSQTKKPYLYSILLVMTAHTSLLATLAVVPLAGIFLYNLHKEKNKLPLKNVVFPITLLFIGVILWFLPFYDGYGYKMEGSLYKGCFSIIVDFFSEKHFCYLLMFILSMIYIQIFANNKVRFISIFTILSFIIFFSIVYRAFPHHCIFFIVYIILFLWLIPELNKINFKTIPFLIIFMTLLFWNHLYHMRYVISNPNKMIIVEYIKNRNKVGLISVLEYQNSDILPYLPDYKQLHINPNYNDHPDVLNKHVIKLLSKEKRYDTLYLVSAKRINANSKEFVLQDSKSEICKKVYVTIFNKKNVQD